MAIITIRIDKEAKKLMKQIRVNWSEFIRSAIRSKIGKREKKLSEGYFKNEKLRRKSQGEPIAEEIIRMFREEQYANNSD